MRTLIGSYGQCNNGENEVITHQRTGGTSAVYLCDVPHSVWGYLQEVQVAQEVQIHPAESKAESHNEPLKHNPTVQKKL